MGSNRDRGRTARLAVFVTSLAAAFWGQELGPDALTFRGSQIVSGRPLADAAEMLQARYGKAVTYEDPVWQWRGDFKDPAASSNRPGGRGAVQRTVNLPADLQRISPTLCQRMWQAGRPRR